MRREKVEYLMTTGMIEGKRSRGKREKKDVGWTNKVSKSRMSNRCTGIEMHGRL